MSERSVAGWQILMLVFAALFAGAVVDKLWLPPIRWTSDAARIVGFIVLAAVLFGIPALRRKCLDLLSVPLAPSRLGEVAAVVLLHFVTVLGIFGAVALWWWSTGGEPALARHLGSIAAPPNPIEQSFATDYLIRTFLLGGLAAPFLEEIAFRGLMYRAWEQRWGWVTAAFFTSIVFAAFHATGVSQFFASLLLIALYRRTGSLWACVLCHSVYNLLMWYPLGGRLITPGPGQTGALGPWTPYIACLAIAFFAIPIYLWMSRDAAAFPARD